MHKVVFYIDLMGESFSPNKVESLIGNVFINKSEFGEKSPWGTFQRGGASIKKEVSPWTSYEDALIEFLGEYSKYIDVFKEHGATEIILHIDVFYYAQCNLEVEPWIIKLSPI